MQDGDMRTSPDAEESIRCTASGCSCSCFRPGGVRRRRCERCGHGWVAHALEKLRAPAQQPSSWGPVEVALPGLVFDLSSLVLYGAQAVPVRLKILLDRLYSVLTPEQVGHILRTLGWTLGDYVRGYMLQFPSGKVLDRWLMVTPEEELLILKQFLRFGETRPIVELMTIQSRAATDHELISAPKTIQANIGPFMERNRRTPGAARNPRGDSRAAAGVRRPDDAGRSLPRPLHCPSSALVPSTKEAFPSSQMAEGLRRPGGTGLAERFRQDGGGRGREKDLASTIKADPDTPDQVLSMWHHERYLQSGVARQESTSSLAPSSNSFPIPTSSSLHPSISYSPPKLSLDPLPSFSSSFLCPLPSSSSSSSSFSASLHPLTPSSSSSLRPLPSSLCSLPSLSPAGGRKGRVCCAVCGKSFYDKGTLKIHYNAVHLKIKHRCTVAGCTMVFSSLRSRNRHSANPNPRLHTGAHRSTDSAPNASSEAHVHKDKDLQTQDATSCTLWQQEGEARVQALRNGFLRRDKAHSPPPPLSLSQDTEQDLPLTDRSYLHPQAPPPPALLTACRASSPDSPPTLLPPAGERRQHPLSIQANHSGPAPPPGPGPPASRGHDATQGKRGESGEPVPKKKPRKSSMPVKIERERAEEEEGHLI